MKKTLILAVAALLATSGECVAEVWIDSYRIPDPAPGVVACRVRVYGTNAFANLKIMNQTHTDLGLAHQANLPRSSVKIYPTVWLDEFDLPIEDAELALDTHFLFTQDQVAAVGAAAVETNLRDNPAGLPEDPFGYVYGNGTFDATGLSFAIKGDLDPWAYDLMQVVLVPDVMDEGRMLFLTGSYWEYDSPNPGYRPMDVWIPSPAEPGTAVLLAMGAAGLLGLRLFPKRRRDKVEGLVSE